MTVIESIDIDRILNCWEVFPFNHVCSLPQKEQLEDYIVSCMADEACQAVMVESASNSNEGECFKPTSSDTTTRLCSTGFVAMLPTGEK